MFSGCIGVLIVAAGFMTEMPEMIKTHLESTVEKQGVFTMTKKDDSGKEYVSKGVYRVRPGIDFEWRTLKPFATFFYATPERYVYSNEEEVVSKRLSELPGVKIDGAQPNYSLFFKIFDALYKEEAGKFYLKAKPKQSDIVKLLERIEAEGKIGDWYLRIVFKNRTELNIHFCNTAR